METSRSDLICRYETYLPVMMRVTGFYEYARQVYDYLELMKPGSVLNLQASQEEHLKWLLVTVGAFLAASEHWMDFETNDDYTKLRRKPLADNFRRLMRRMYFTFLRQRRRSLALWVFHTFPLFTTKYS